MTSLHPRRHGSFDTHSLSRPITTSAYLPTAQDAIVEKTPTKNNISYTSSQSTTKKPLYSISSSTPLSARASVGRASFKQSVLSQSQRHFTHSSLLSSQNSEQLPQKPHPPRPFLDYCDSLEISSQPYSSHLKKQEILRVFGSMFEQLPEMKGSPRNSSSPFSFRKKTYSAFSKPPRFFDEISMMKKRSVVAAVAATAAASVSSGSSSHVPCTPKRSMRPTNTMLTKELWADSYYQQILQKSRLAQFSEEMRAEKNALTTKDTIKSMNNYFKDNFFESNHVIPYTPQLQPIVSRHEILPKEGLDQKDIHVDDVSETTNVEEEEPTSKPSDELRITLYGTNIVFKMKKPPNNQQNNSPLLLSTSRRHKSTQSLKSSSKDRNILPQPKKSADQTSIFREKALSIVSDCGEVHLQINQMKSSMFSPIAKKPKKLYRHTPK